MAYMQRNKDPAPRDNFKKKENPAKKTNMGLDLV